MRCWHPRAEEVVNHVKNFNPDEIILMPYTHNILQQHQDHQLKNGKIFVKKII